MEITEYNEYEQAFNYLEYIDEYVMDEDAKIIERAHYQHMHKLLCDNPPFPTPCEAYGCTWKYNSPTYRCACGDTKLYRWTLKNCDMMYDTTLWEKNIVGQLVNLFKLNR